jgi:hypothetical protein
VTDLSAIFRSDVLPEQARNAIDAVKLLPGGASFICELHFKECSIVELDRHHKIPQECGGPTNVENMLYGCSGCHQFMHRIAIRLTSMKAHKLTPLELVQQYARRVNPKRESEVVSAILVSAQLVAAYRTQKADHALAPPDISIAAAEIPKELHSQFKQISREIKRGDGRPIGMANLVAISILEFTAKHRPETREAADRHIQEKILGIAPIARPVIDRNVETFEEEVM